jgi:hypothetical protein
MKDWVPNIYGPHDDQVLKYMSPTRACKVPHFYLNKGRERIERDLTTIALALAH